MVKLPFIAKLEPVWGGSHELKYVPVAHKSLEEHREFSPADTLNRRGIPNYVGNHNAFGNLVGGVPPEVGMAAIRFSPGRSTSRREIEEVVARL
jgi:hypothetical protein